MDEAGAGQVLAAVPAAAFPTVELPRAADQVTRALVDGMRAGAAPPGARLPRDVDLAEHFGVSRSVVRDALDRLRRAGLIDVRRGNGGGATVRSSHIPTALLTDRDQIGDRELRGLLEARRTLEERCAVLAAVRATPAELDAVACLAAALADVREDPDAFIETDVRFHLAIARASGNAPMATFLAQVFRELAAVRFRYPTRYGSMATAEAYQHDTVSALRDGDPDLVAASIDRHLAGLEEHFLGRPLAP
jgi:GntR family transcriptional repressor for pyruvate dehydrogenase complex